MKIKNINDKNEVCNFVVGNILNHKQFALGTSDKNGNPWVVALNLTIDSEMNLVWESSGKTEHSINIKNNQKASICIFSEEDNFGDFGFYAKGSVYEVFEENELEKGIEIRYKKKKKVPNIKEFKGDSENRIYKMIIEEAWVNDDNHIKVKIDLSELKSKWIINKK